jgi:hypothetical protein
MTLAILVSAAAVVVLARPWRSADPGLRDYSALLEACIVTLIVMLLVLQR